MNIDELLKRSKQDIDINGVGCANSVMPLVPVMPTKHLYIEPIWEKPIDDIEGPLYQKYINEHPAYDNVFLRKAVAERLYTAATLLPNNWKLILRAGHRPVDVQKSILRSLVEKYLTEHPSATQNEALEFARIYVSDPEIKLPPHCCGAAVDIDALDVTANELVDFGCPVNTDDEISFLHSPEITIEQRINRSQLLRAMLEAGFASCQQEWWHYSYGDQLWARFYDEPQALYGIVEPSL